MAIVWDNKPSSIQWDDSPNTPSNPASMSWGDVAETAISNIPSSGVEYGKTIAQPFLHPVDTVTGMRDIAFGGLGKVIPGADVGDQQAKFDAFRRYLADRYGGYENIKRTIANDPVGALADVSSVFTGGGSIAAKLPGMAGKIGSAANSFGRVIEPVNRAKRFVGTVADMAVPDKLPLKMYESAIKPKAPSAKFTREQQIATLQAGLDAGITPTGKGIEKIDDIVSRLNDQIMGKIDEGTKAGARIKVPDVVQRMDSAYEFFSRLPDSETPLAALDKIRDGMLAKGPTMSIAEAQKVKQAIYKVLKDSYGELSTATKEANKAIARGIKEEIATIFPEIKSLNNQESLMLRLEPLIEKAAGRISKRDMLGIGTPMAGMAGASMFGPKAGMALWLTKAVVDNPSVKTYLAIALNKAKKGGMGPGFVEQRLAAYWAGKMAEQEQQSQSGY